jgi:hypothetical protein
MHLLGWVTIHDTHHHMEVLRKNLYLVFLVCGFLGCYSYQSHDLTYQSFCKTHVSHGNNVLSSIAETTSQGLDAFNYQERYHQRIKTQIFPNYLVSE